MHTQQKYHNENSSYPWPVIEPYFTFMKGTSPATQLSHSQNGMKEFVLTGTSEPTTCHLTLLGGHVGDEIRMKYNIQSVSEARSCEVGLMCEGLLCVSGPSNTVFRKYLVIKLMD